MLLSIVTGTWNRLPYLQLMLASARRQFVKGIDYEFVIVDGGSTDGTLDYLREQPDVRLMAQGELLGAIKAFGDGARAARGEYVLLANDDVLFHAGSILPAIRHLESHPSCAAVAFADNRTSIVTGDGKQYRTEGIGCTLPDGTPSMVTYAQVGLFRKTLGDAAGWWGDTDPIMSKSRVYGGDSYLSARLWELGYTVDPLPECVVDDLIVRDGLRQYNGAHSGQDSSAYYERFPTVQLPAQRQDGERSSPVQERLRVLFLPIYESGYPQAANKEPWLTEGFQALGALCLEVDYLNTNLDLPALVKAWQPNLILTQIQGVGAKLTTATLAAMRAACPSALLVNWNGDAHMDGLTSPPMLDLLRHVDLQTTINAAALPVYEREGIAAAYWQIAYRESADIPPDVPAWDVLYQANWYEYRRPLFELLYRLPASIQVGVYGNERRAVGNTHYNFAAQSALYASATITVGDTFPFNTKAFVSNRVFQALMSGAFLLQQESEALEEYTGLVAGVHYAAWRDVDDLRDKLLYWLAPEQAERRRQIAQQGQAFVRANYSPAAQVRKLLTELLPRLAEQEPQHEPLPV